MGISVLCLRQSYRLCLLKNTVIRKYGKQKQSTRGVLRERCSENMQQIYSRTPMSKCDVKCKATLLKPHFGMGFLL